MGNTEQGRSRTGGYVEEERVSGRGHVLPEEENHKITYRSGRHNRARPSGGAATAAQEGEGLKSVDGRVYLSPHSTNRSSLRFA